MRALDALKKQFPNTLSYSEGSTLNMLLELDDCLKKAATADKIVVCLGELPSTEIPGNIDDLSLAPAQRQLVKELKKKKLILLLK